MPERTEYAYVVDFDGTITTNDLSSELAAYYGGPVYLETETKYRRREIPIREWLKQMAKLLPPDVDHLKKKSLEWATIRKGFIDFLDYARDQNSMVVIASDGFGFYIEPILEGHGLLEKIDYIYRNETITGENGVLKVISPHAHPTCPVCGNCKAGHVVNIKETGKPVIYAGDGSNDRFGAFWSDHICARDRLADSCEENGISYSPWNDFYDIMKIEKPGLKDCTHTSLCCPQGQGVKKGI